MITVDRNKKIYYYYLLAQSGVEPLTPFDRAPP
jgi:hypothetical protein